MLYMHSEYAVCNTEIDDHTISVLFDGGPTKSCSC